MADSIADILAQLQAEANGETDSVLPQIELARQQQLQGKERVVWMGRWGSKRAPHPDHRVPDDGPRMQPVPGAKTKKTITYAEAIGLPWFWSESKRQEMYKRASEAFGKDISNIHDFLAVWKQAVDLAAQSWEASDGKKALTPYDIFDMMRREAPGGAAAIGGSQTGPRSIRQKVTSINRLSDGSAWQLLKSAAREALGREPTHEELRSFAARANQIAAENPDVTTTVMETDENGNTTTRVDNQPGATAADFQTAAEEEMDTEEAGAYQAATTYFDALVRGLDSVV